MRPGTVVAISLLAAAAGAAGVIAAGGGGFGSHTQTVVLRDPLGAGATRSVVVSKPVASQNFQPEVIYRQRAPGVVTVFAHFDDGTNEQGSGFVVSAAGYVLTAAHVITTDDPGLAGTAPAKVVYLQFTDGDRARAHIVGWDPFDDVGLLRVDPKAHPLRVVPLGSSASLRIGAPVATIGSPFGTTDSLAVGVVSGTHRAIPSLTADYDLVDAIQTDAPINEGDSGGPLLDAHGRAIGIDAQIRSNAGGGFEGVAFAIPIDLALRSLTQLLAHGHVSYAYAGLTTEDLRPQVARRYGYGSLHGALIDGVVAGGPAAAAGLRPGTHNVRIADQEVTVGGDAIVAIDGLPVASSDDVARIISERLLPGETAEFTIVRGARRLQVPVKLGERRI